jgi:hypothetical protein
MLGVIRGVTGLTNGEVVKRLYVVVARPARYRPEID